MEKFYITTPIYFPNGNLHLGHCYTTVCCDSIARFKRLDGFDVCYLTGTDEHGQKIEKKAIQEGMNPKAYVDMMDVSIKKLWKLMNISYDRYIRTTDEMHEAAVAKIFDRLYEKGDIYKSEYSGMYCMPCESFWTESQLVDGKCPDCKREVTKQKEESYFFRLTKYADRLRDLLKNTDFLRPETRVNEMISNFIDAGLTDLSVSRTTFKWGIPVSFDKGHIIYVWIDALSNYITALGFLSNDESAFKKYWPADIHVMAKEIVRFHAIIWPALLMALDIPLPKRIFGHGWMLFDGDKMSKSKGNVIDPYILCEKFSVDAMRYYLLNALPYGQDGYYSIENLINRINTDLVNNLGNLVSRTTAMSVQYFNGNVPKQGELTELDLALISNAESALNDVRVELNELRIGKALDRIMELSSACNKYIDENTPWVLAKAQDGSKEKKRLETVLFNLLEAIRYLSILLEAFIPSTSERIFDALGIKEANLKDFDSLKKFGLLKGTVNKSEPLFVRINKDAILKELAKQHD